MSLFVLPNFFVQHPMVKSVMNTRTTGSAGPQNRGLSLLFFINHIIVEFRYDDRITAVPLPKIGNCHCCFFSFVRALCAISKSDSLYRVLLLLHPTSILFF